MWSWWNCLCGVVVQGRCGGDWFLGCRLGQEWYASRLARSQMQFRWNCCPVHQVINKLYTRISILTGLLCSWINQEDHIHVELKDYKSLVICSHGAVSLIPNSWLSFSHLLLVIDPWVDEDSPIHSSYTFISVRLEKWLFCIQCQ